MLIILTAKIQALKKGVPKGDKKRKKEVSVEVAQLEQDLQNRHDRELAALKTQAHVLVCFTPNVIVQRKYEDLVILLQ